MSKIFFWSGAREDACSFYRCAEPARVLKARGHAAAWDPQVGLATAMMSDVIVIARPTEPPTQHLMAQLLRVPEHQRPRIVVELDDDLLNLPEHHLAYPMMADERRRERLQRALALADRVTVTNEHLAEQVRGWSNDDTVRVVPNYVSERFVVPNVPTLDAFGTPVITWAGSDTHRRDFDQVATALRQLLRERTDFRVRIVGAPYADRLRSAVPEDAAYARISQVPWIEGVPRYIPTLAGHIGLAPLADDLFNRSKSDIRLKELAARGMAVTTSDVGPYRESEVPRALVGDRLGVYGDWAGLLWALLVDSDQREAFAVKALDWAQANTLEAHAAEWEAALLN